MKQQKNSPQTTLQSFSPECYFLNPLDGTPGWTIQFPRVFATSRAEAAEIIRKMPYFDCFIDIEFEQFNVYPEKKFRTSASLNFVVKHTYSTPNHTEIISALEAKLREIKRDPNERSLYVRTELNSTKPLPK